MCATLCNQKSFICCKVRAKLESIDNYCLTIFLFFLHQIYSTRSLKSAENSKETPSALRHLNAVFMALYVPLHYNNPLSNRSSQAFGQEISFSLSQASFHHSFSPPFLFLIKERSSSLQKRIELPPPWTWTSLLFGISLPLSFSILLWRALYSLQSGAKY